MNRVKQVNRVFLWTVVLSIVGGFINSEILKYTNDFAIIAITSQVILILPAVIYIIVNKINVAQQIRFKGLRISTIILLILFAYLISPLMNLVNALSLLFFKNETSIIMNNIVGKHGLLLSVTLIALVPAILEECVYRGVFYNEYRKVNVLKGILLSGFMFGIVHGNVNQFSYAFLMGIIFALVIEATDSILSTMIIHFCINGTSIFLLYIYPKLLTLLESVYGSEQFSASEFQTALEGGLPADFNLEFVLTNYGLSAILCTALAVIVFKTIAKNSGRWDDIKNIFHRKDTLVVNQEEKSNTSILSISLIIAIVICVGLMVYYEIVTYKLNVSNAKELLSITFNFIK
jgi:membrane protease YdiL (CAAX protease family)